MIFLSPIGWILRFFKRLGVQEHPDVLVPIGICLAIDNHLERKRAVRTA